MVNVLCGVLLNEGWDIEYNFKKILYMFVIGNCIDKFYYFEGILNLFCII